MLFKKKNKVGKKEDKLGNELRELVEISEKAVLKLENEQSNNVNTQKTENKNIDVLKELEDSFNMLDNLFSKTLSKVGNVPKNKNTMQQSNGLYNKEELLHPEKILYAEEIISKTQKPLENYNPQKTTDNISHSSTKEPETNNVYNLPVVNPQQPKLNSDLEEKALSNLNKLNNNNAETNDIKKQVKDIFKILSEQKKKEKQQKTKPFTFS